MIHVLPLTIILKSPLLAGAVANGEANSKISLDYIPGSSLRGACIASYLRQNPDHAENLPNEPIARQLFFDGSVAFLNGYPGLPGKTAVRMLPVPCSWHTHKGMPSQDQKEWPIYDFTLYDEPLDKPRGEKSPFFAPPVRSISHLRTPQRRSTVHNASVDPQVKSAAGSTVFRYETLEAGQTFAALIIAPSKNLLDEVIKLLPNGRYHLGGSHTAGYGSISLETGPPTVWNNGQEGEATAAGSAGMSRHTVISLLSDTILRTPQGVPSTDFHAALKAVLGEPYENLAQPLKSYAATTLTGGFNRKWGFPLPQSVALSMGSTYVYDAQELPLSALDGLLLNGIGLRRGEGFGRLAANLNPLPQFKARAAPKIKIESRKLSPGSIKLAQDMAARRLQKAIEDGIIAYTKDITFGRKPENSQLSRLRLVVRQARRDDNLALITDHLGQLKRSVEQFRRRRIKDLPRESDERLTLSWFDWLTRRAQKNDALAIMGIDPQDKNLQIAGQALEDPKQLAQIKLAAVCSLIETVLHHALKEQADEYL